jgi:hypothetical protein
MEIEIIKNQSRQLFQNTEFIFEYVDDRLLAKKICNWPLRRQMYHMFHSMDQWFINPFKYKDHRPDGFDIAGMNTHLEMNALKKDELLEYYLKTKAKVQGYLSSLDSAELIEYPEGCKFTKLDLILGQFRHIMFHIGMIHGCILMENSEIPNYVGLER